MPLRVGGPDIVTAADQRAIGRELEKNRRRSKQRQRRDERHRSYGKKLLRDLVEGRVSRDEVDRRLSRMGLDADELAGSGFGLGDLGPVGRAVGDVGQVARGSVGMLVDYAGAAARDTRDLATGRNVRALARGDIGDVRLPFRRLTRLAARDLLGMVAAAETAIPEPSFLPEALRREVIEIDPENVSIRRGSGEVDPLDTARARRMWHDDPLIAAASLMPAVGGIARAGSEGALRASLRQANPELGYRQAARAARRESRMPGSAAAHGLEGGIEPRILSGEFAEATGRPWSRHPIGRAGQRAFDRSSELIEATRGPGAKFATSQRAARMEQRAMAKAARQEEMWLARKERTISKGIGKTDPAREEALIAALEGPRSFTPRQAAETKVKSLQLAIARPRTREEAQARVAELEQKLDKGLRPLVDKEFPPDVRRSEQARRNILPHTRGKRAQAGLENKLEMEGLGMEGTVLRSAYSRIEEKILARAEQPNPPEHVTRVAALIEERDALRQKISDPEVVFGGQAGDFGVVEAAPDVKARLGGQVAHLERALAGQHLEGRSFQDALEAFEAVSARTEALGTPFLDMTPEQLASRRNRVTELWGEQGLLPEGTELEARGYFPHRGSFENVPSEGGAPTFAARGRVVGVPRKRPGVLETRRNVLERYAGGDVQTQPKVLSNIARQRVKYGQTVHARQEMYEMGLERVDQDIPEGMVLVRNPSAKAEDLPAEVRSAVLNPDQYARLRKREIGEPEIKRMNEWLDTWLHRGGDRPEWAFDLENTRLVPEGVVRTMLSDVFTSAPRGSAWSIFGAIAATARAATIYVPYGGTRYVAKNTPQNMILLALSKPTAFRHLGRAAITLRRKDPELYDWMKVEAGTIPAAAGLPELIGSTATKAQRIEKTAVMGSRKIAGALGEISDEPWRISAWMQYANDGGFKGPAGWRRLKESNDPAVVRFRDDIAQRVRDDMIDFDTLTPKERESLSRFAFIWPFVRGSGKWPFMYARERPVQSAILSLLAAQHAREPMPGMPQSAQEQGRIDLAGKPRDLGWLLPQMPAMTTSERLLAAGRTLGEGKAPTEELLEFANPAFREAATGGTLEQFGRSLVPGYTTYEKVGRGGSLGEQTIRALGSTVEASKYRKAERKKARDDLVAAWDTVTKAGREISDTLEAIRTAHYAYEEFRDLRDNRAKYAAMNLGRELTPQEKLALLVTVTRKYHPEFDFPENYEERAMRSSDEAVKAATKRLSLLVFGPRIRLKSAATRARSAAREEG